MEEKTILVVDDESRMRKLVKDFLAMNNFRVLEAQDGEEALDIFVKNKGIDYSRVKSMQRFDGIYAQVSLDSHIRDNERFYYVDLIKDDFDVNEFVLNNLYKEMIMEKARLSFNEKAYEIIELRLSGYRYAEISRILSVEKNKIYYVWKKFKNWLIEIDSLDI